MKIYISPMAGITDFSYREIIKDFAPDLLFTEMVNAHLVEIEDDATIKELLKTNNFENTGTQIFGNNKKEILNSFLKVEQIGFNKINLNMGCPQPKIIKNGSGCALLPQTEFVEDLIFTLKSKLNNNTKLSIKIRTEYKDFNNPDFYIDLANKYNLDFICIHGRAQKQFYSGDANWNIISKLSYLPRNIDFIGNGDLFDALEIHKKVQTSKLDGIMLARGIIGNPWLVSQTREILENGKIKTIPTFKTIKDTLIKHLYLLQENKGDLVASMEINKFIKPYFKRFIENNLDLINELNNIIFEKTFYEKIKKISHL